MENEVVSRLEQVKRVARQKRMFYLAPLRGITDRIFRFVFEKHFGRFDYMLAPFVSTIKGSRVRDYHIKDILPNDADGFVNDSKRLIPQIIGCDADGFLLLSRTFAKLGYLSVNWNLGCPAPLITKKRRGSGLLPHKNIIKRFLDDVSPKLPIPLSIKTRIGLENTNDLETLIPIFNDYPLKEVIIHPRLGIQLYDGAVNIDKFEICANESIHKIVYNGDIRSAHDFKHLAQRFPNINSWMIGRGAIENPYLLNQLKDEDGRVCLFEQSIKPFLCDLLDACCADNRRVDKVLGRMKEIWRYLGRYIAKRTGDGAASYEKIMRCVSIAEYREIIDYLKI